MASFALFAPFPREPPSGPHVAGKSGMETLKHDRKNTRGLKNWEERKEICFLEESDEKFSKIFKVPNETFHLIELL